MSSTKSNKNDDEIKAKNIDKKKKKMLVGKILNYVMN